MNPFIFYCFALGFASLSALIVVVEEEKGERK